MRNDDVAQVVATWVHDARRRLESDLLISGFSADEIDEALSTIATEEEVVEDILRRARQAAGGPPHDCFRR